MNSFLEYNDGNVAVGTYLDTYDLEDLTPVPSNAPRVYTADGVYTERLPSNLNTVPGAGSALDCTAIEESPSSGKIYNHCPGDVTQSADLSHFVFATESTLFAPEGQRAAPGSVYDDDTATGAVTVASRDSNGEPIPSQPTDLAGDPLQIPGVSADGSHILMAAPGIGPCGASSCPEVPCRSFWDAVRCPSQPSNLYMRIDGAITIDISKSELTGEPADVNYIGMTANGAKVYFTTDERLTSEDRDSSTDLYMWSQSGAEEDPPHPLSLISGGESTGVPGKPGNSDECAAEFTSGCNVIPYSHQDFCLLRSNLGGSCASDSFIASESGEIYFFSPEQLDGSKGIPNKWNLYDYRNGRDQFVAAFTTGPYCYAPTTGGGGYTCSNTPISRMEVTPSGAHMAFVTASQITRYDNAGHSEMYTYDPATEAITCVSCNPSGEVATSEVFASQDGLFLTEDGRTFFSTNEALVPTDTNRAEDVYEYVEGRPQLITPGTGDTPSLEDQESFGAIENTPVSTVSAPTAQMSTFPPTILWFLRIKMAPF